MRICVCIKQVPATARVQMDPETGTLLRGNAETKMNPFDLFALEAAFRIKEECGASVTALTMGPPAAGDILREAYMMGADEGVLMSDRAFAGADVLATAYTLSEGVRALGGFDLILCGRQTTDGDTAQVGPELAEFLSIPHVAWVKRIQTIGESEIIVSQDLADSVETVSVAYPCLLTIEKDIYMPRLPSYRKKVASASREIWVLTKNDLEAADSSRFGLDGSATQVEKIFEPEPSRERRLYELDYRGSADVIFGILASEKLIGEGLTL